jgi:hypothetical protein
MKLAFKLLVAAIAVITALGMALAQDSGDLQIMSIKGKLLGDEGKQLAEYDYLKMGRRYRLLPESQVELSSLDGSVTFRLAGPGIVELKAGKLSLNGKPVKGIGQTAVLGPATSVGQGGKLSGLLMRDAKGVVLNLKNPKGGQTNIKLYSGYYALVIGVGAYRSGWPSLPNPAKDAKEVAEALKSLGWRVDTLLEPDSESLRHKLNALIVEQGREKNQAILVWYSGHGHTLVEADGSKLGYIVPVDAPNPHHDELGFMAKGLSMRNLETVARRIQAKHVMMIFDSCFSGAIFSLSRAVPSPYIEEKVSNPVRQFITAGTEDEKVPDASVFKTVFIQAVKNGHADVNRDGYVTGEELGSYLQEKVVNYSHKTQHPQFGKINNPHLDKGDFVFAPLVRDSRGPSTETAHTRRSTETAHVKETLQDVAPRKQTQAPLRIAPQLVRRIRTLLRAARADMMANRMTSPPDDCALNKFNQVLKLNPGNPLAQRGLRFIVSKYIAMAQARMRFGDYDRAEWFLSQAELVSRNDQNIRDARAELSQARHRQKLASVKISPEPVSAVAAPPVVAMSRTAPAGARFNKDAQGIITDRHTGLQWLMGPDKDINWLDAEIWLHELELAGGRWRFPLKEELMGLYEKGAGREILQKLLRTSGDWIWSATVRKNEYGANSSKKKIYSAWIYNLKTRKGLMVEPISKTSNRVLAVRPLKPGGDSARGKTGNIGQADTSGGVHRFIKQLHGVVMDRETGLQWLVGPDKDINNKQARQWISELRDAGGSWRLPSLKELKALCLEDGVNKLPDGLRTGGKWIWTKARNKRAEFGTRLYNPVTGKDLWTHQSSSVDNRVIAVRGGK